ncbi:ATP-grasp domain-containing protein [Alkalihalobacillus hemicellulosilyticus]|uniref:Cyanophycin synthetase n=1 Tax=Halalkalibacter hemicellulosilyticusJCM 9152 TaxID=1236971 RepID=W4QKZ9_9BACI|nr:ATP-grasp domain-containing protein [Halalkalibacter hemicellulosilyticus]GAE32766.1 cyanophycin synthetase [Halalkalibacter hemicellulosilyticusJCM 9152]
MNDYIISPLSHLAKSIPSSAEGYLLSGYSIALEGWRRGLDLSMKVIFEKNSKTRVPIFTLSNDKQSYTFKYTRANTVSGEAISICVNKELTKKVLNEAKVPTPLGTIVSNEVPTRKIISIAKKIGYPIVIKPSDGTGGKGVIANIKSNQELKEAIDYIKKDLKLTSAIIIEKFQTGYDYRCYVIDNKVVAAYKRESLYIIGNGKSTIKQLLEQKEQHRRSNPVLKKRSLRIDKETDLLLSRLGYDFNSVPPKGEKVYLKSKNNVTSGGEATDMTDKISENIKKLAIDAVNAIPTLTHAGVDMIIDEDNDKGVVLEINSRPHITAHLYPSFGEPRDVPSALIDYFFPETIGYNRNQRANLYFDFDQVLETTYFNGSIDEIQIPNIPGDIHLSRYNLYLSEKKDIFSKWLQLQATRNHISGHIKSFNNHLSIVLAGTEKDVQALLSLIHQKAQKYKGFKLEEKVRNTPVKQGFYIINSSTNPKSDTPVPLNYKSDVNQLIEAIYKTNNMQETKKPTNIEYDVLKSQLQNATAELNTYKKIFGELPSTEKERT